MKYLLLFLILCLLLRDADGWYPDCSALATPFEQAWLDCYGKCVEPGDAATSCNTFGTHYAGLANVPAAIQNKVGTHKIKERFNNNGEKCEWKCSKKGKFWHMHTGPCDKHGAATTKRKYICTGHTDGYMSTAEGENNDYLCANRECASLLRQNGIGLCTMYEPPSNIAHPLFPILLGNPPPTWQQVDAECTKYQALRRVATTVVTARIDPTPPPHLSGNGNAYIICPGTDSPREHYEYRGICRINGVDEVHRLAKEEYQNKYQNAYLVEGMVLSELVVIITLITIVCFCCGMIGGGFALSKYSKLKNQNETN